MSESALESQAVFTLRGHNPDVLTCIANLSNDEVFTPPVLANQMLDTVQDAWAANNDGANIWANPGVTFLDPFTKSGVFLREIVARLTAGLEDQFPDLQERVDHILTKQVFGIGLTRLTSLMARRSIYCSKDATGPHSIAQSFDRDWGNIWFDRTEHEWIGEKCKYCGAGRSGYSRDSALESHAYAFIHTPDIKARLSRMFGADVQFDVIIGNPPYQLGSDGGTRDIPIYHLFVEQAKKLEPRILTMIIQSRWMASGLGLKEFRAVMLADRRLRSIVDYPSSSDVFAGTGFRGGVCRFVWDSQHDGDCEVTTIRGSDTFGPVPRQLNEYDVFVRDVRAISILRKVRALNETSIVSILSADKQFGWTSNFDGFHDQPLDDDVPLYYVRRQTRHVGYVSRSEIQKSPELVDTWKVMVPKAGSGGDSIPDSVLSKSLIAPSPSVCTQTFLFFSLTSELAAINLQTYLQTRFFRFLVTLRKLTQDATRGTYTWVPVQDWDRPWTDSELYEKYGLTDDEVAFIESQVRA